VSNDQTDRIARALVVEDNKINRLVAIQMLKQANASGVEAGNAATALEMLRSQDFDLVLMDVDMPVMDGLEATRAIRNGEAGETNRNIPIIAMTGYTDAADEKRCYDAGMTAHLKKPLSMSRFIEVVRSALQY